ncbi:hypothetical protein T12_13150 [Trichinella patagoniensis]|uniref:Uncharacterized protein n=1 Tax=Trichinella patagoniensis TaxID=990121 RepID=A0A0V0Z3J8_9BILA|nr:hypothetical protein T12_13150 [Trichinella patagoniensis]
MLLNGPTAHFVYQTHRHLHFNRLPLLRVFYSQLMFQLKNHHRNLLTGLRILYCNQVVYSMIRSKVILKSSSTLAQLYRSNLSNLCSYAVTPYCLRQHLKGQFFARAPSYTAFITLDNSLMHWLSKQ